MKTNRAETSLSIALPETPRRLYEEIGGMLTNLLSCSYSSTTLVHDGDVSALDSDLLLLVGDCQAYQAYPVLLGEHRHDRPTTILWMLDTLPPLCFTEKAAEISSRLAIYNKSLLFLRTRLKSIVNLTPIGFRRKMGLAACSALLSGLDQELESTSQDELTHLDVNSRYEILGRYQWMRSSYDAGWLDRIVVSTQSKTDFLNKMGIPARVVPFGYHPNMGRDLGLEREIDVLFIGELEYGRRKPVLGRLVDELGKLGINLTVESGDCYGDKRNELLSRSKICLNIPRFSWDIPAIRLFMSMGCGSMVVSEHSGDSAPFTPGQHFIQSSADQLPETIAYYLQHDDEREAIARNAQRLVTEELTLQNSISSILSPCDLPTSPA